MRAAKRRTPVPLPSAIRGIIPRARTALSAKPRKRGDKLMTRVDAKLPINRAQLVPYGDLAFSQLLRDVAIVKSLSGEERAFALPPRQLIQLF